MKPFIRITRDPYEEPHHLKLIVTASNGRQQGELEIYANASDLAWLAKELRQVPARQNEVRWELGSEDPKDNFALYYRLRVFGVGSSGHCAVELRFNNNRPPPEREIAEFSIAALLGDIDRFADLLDGFSKLEHRVLEWNVTDGELRQHALA